MSATKKASSAPSAPKLKENSVMQGINEKPLKTTEEFDCERRGYKLTKTVLGTGAYAKVKLAYVSNAKMEKDKRLAEELREKGTNKVSISISNLLCADYRILKSYLANLLLMSNKCTKNYID